MRTMNGSGGSSYRSKKFDQLTITVLGNETFLLGGQVSGTFSLHEWSTLKTITDTDYIPSNSIYGVSVDSNGVARQTMYTQTGEVKVYQAGNASATNPELSIIGKP